MKKLIVTALLVAAVAASIGYRWLARPAAEVYAVKRGTAISAVYGTVKVQPTVKMLVRTRVGGVIRLARCPDGREFAAGMEIKEGTVLGVVESSELGRELTKAESDLATAEGRQKLGPPSAQLLKTSEAALKRLEKLAENKDAPASEVERLRNEVQALRDRVNSEQLELDHALTVLREQIGGLRERKARCEVKAPMDGLLGMVNVVSGDLVVEGAPLLVVATQKYYLEGQINEEDVGPLRKRMPAAISLYSYPNHEFKATLTDILPAGENQRYVVKLDLDAPPDNLLAGMTGEMNIILGRNENTLVIPSRALLSDKVLVVEGDVIRSRTVRIGLHTLERTEIVEGLKEGERVVVADHDRFSAGQKVRAIVVKM